MKTYTVRRCARPIRLTRGNPRAVLCIHGFAGYPGEMAYPAQRLVEAGWDVCVPRLTGHGTCGDDFASTGVDDWRRQVADEWMNMNGRYDHVCVLGHSMGGLLALDLARRYPVPSVALMAPAIGIRRPGTLLLPLAGLFIRRIPVPWSADHEYTFFDERDDDDDEFLGREYWGWRWITQTAGLLKLQRRTESSLNQIRSPVLGIFGDADNVIQGPGREVLEKNLGGDYRFLVIPDCGHYIPYDKMPGNKETAMDAVLDRFGR